MNLALDTFIEEARGVSIEEAAKRLGLKFSGKRLEHPQPCPFDGGTDTFSFNTSKNKWNCRAGGCGGQDAIGMAAHCLHLDLHRRDGFLEACAAVVGQPIPDGGERESDDDRRARETRLAQKRAQNAVDAEKLAATQQDFRERERQKARGIVEAAGPVAMHGVVRRYLAGRGCGLADRWLRASADQPYWHGQDDRGAPIVLHSGPAMVIPFMAQNLSVIGCHITWVDMARPPKFRPLLTDPATGEILPGKKMRGSKKGGLLPLAGDPAARRWVGGEGVENGLAFAGWEGFRDDTFYFAAGDLGNLSGPAEPSSRFAHPTLTRPDRKGVERPVMIAGPAPKAGRDADDAMWIGDQVDELVLLADGDSERVMTAAAMARARKRHARPGRLIPIVWPRPGYDFSRMAAEAFA